MHYTFDRFCSAGTSLAIVAALIVIGQAWYMGRPLFERVEGWRVGLLLMLSFVNGGVFFGWSGDERQPKA